MVVAVAEQGKASAPVEYTAHSVEHQRIRPAEQPHIHQEFAVVVGPAATRTQKQQQRSGQYIPAVVGCPVVGEGYPAVRPSQV